MLHKNKNEGAKIWNKINKNRGHLCILGQKKKDNGQKSPRVTH